MNFGKLQPLLEHFTEIGPSGCAVSVSLEGKPVYEHYQGLADVESGRPIGPDTIYRLFSNTKVVTAVAVLILYERGLLLLNDPVEAYLPEFAHPRVYRYEANNLAGVRPAASSIRIKDLLTMSSGLTYEGAQNLTQQQTARVMEKLEEKGGYSLRAFSEAISKVPLAFDPGTRWNYGYSHDVAGALVEAVSGRSFGRFLKEEIFEPLGMENTFFFLPEDKRKCLATLYSRENNVLKPNYDYEKFYAPGHLFESGGAGLLSTLEDLAAFGRMLSMGGSLNGIRIVGRKSIELMRKNHLAAQQLDDFKRTHGGSWDFLAGYGYGLGVRTMMDMPGGGCNGSEGEFGWAGAAGTWLLADVRERLAAVYMQQLRPGNREEYCHPRIRAVVCGALDGPEKRWDL